MTPDDIGCEADKTNYKLRARQNVILELGYFYGKLGREHTLVFTKGDIDLPSDFLGITWEKFDENEGWKFKLVRELKEAGFDIKPDNII